MKTLQRQLRLLLILALTTWLLIPGLSWSHVALTYPKNVVESCRDKGNYNWPEDGSGIAKGPCREQALVYGSSGDRWYPFSHWHEFAALVPGFEDLENVKKVVPDGKLCSAGDDKKRSFNLALDWERTTVPVENGEITINISGTQPHVPSYAKIFMTRPGYSADKPLTWNDLQLLETKSFSDYRTDWANSVLKTQPTTEPKTIGFFEFKVKVPNGQTGPATIFMLFQRLDTGNEGFYNCAYITLGDGTVIPFPWFSRGPLITQDMVPKVNESVRLRVFDGSNKKFSEALDVKLKITDQNLQPEQWLPQLVSLLGEYSNIIKIGKQSGSNIVFDPSDPVGNHMYVSKNDYSVQTSIINDGGPPPTPTVQITGPSELKSAESYTFKSTLNNFQSNFHGYSWAPEGIQASDLNAPTVSGTALTVTTPQKFVVRVNVRDGEHGNSYQASKQITVIPKDGGGGEHPAYAEGTEYKEGDIVTNINQENVMKTYKCKPYPYSGWCKGAGWAYAPGKGTAWKDAWDEIQ